MQEEIIGGAGLADKPQGARLITLVSFPDAFACVRLVALSLARCLQADRSI